MLLNRNLIKNVCVLLLFAGPVAGVEQKTETVPMRLWYDRPATNWMTSALPIGNGELGALFFGGVECEQILFNEKTCGQGGRPVVGLIRNLVMYGFILMGRKMFGNIVVNFLWMRL